MLARICGWAGSISVTWTNNGAHHTALCPSARVLRHCPVVCVPYPSAHGYRRFYDRGWIKPKGTYISLSREHDMIRDASRLECTAVT